MSELKLAMSVDLAEDALNIFFVCSAPRMFHVVIMGDLSRMIKRQRALVL